MSDHEKLKTIGCPGCGTVGSVQLTTKFVVKPLGTYSLAGVQTKVSAVETPALACTECDFVKLPKEDA